MCTECEEEVRHRNSCVYHNRDLEDKRHQNSVKKTEFALKQLCIRASPLTAGVGALPEELNLVLEIHDLLLLPTPPALQECETGQGMGTAPGQGLISKVDKEKF